MSSMPDPGNAGFRDYSPGPHSGMPTDPNARVVEDSFDRSLRRFLHGRAGRWTGIAIVCVIVAIGIYMSIT